MSINKLLVEFYDGLTTVGFTLNDFQKTLYRSVINAVKKAAKSE